LNLFLLTRARFAMITNFWQTAVQISPFADLLQGDFKQPHYGCSTLPHYDLGSPCKRWAGIGMDQGRLNR